jgi:hypothetical protein
MVISAVAGPTGKILIGEDQVLYRKIISSVPLICDESDPYVRGDFL